jgi:hypothetical protein
VIVRNGDGITSPNRRIDLVIRFVRSEITKLDGIASYFDTFVISDRAKMI